MALFKLVDGRVIRTSSYEVLTVEELRKELAELENKAAEVKELLPQEAVAEPAAEAQDEPAPEQPAPAAEAVAEAAPEQPSEPAVTSEPVQTEGGAPDQPAEETPVLTIN